MVKNKICYDKDNKNVLLFNRLYLSFIDYLKKKFKTTDVINTIWGFNYWGRAVNDWDELHPVDGFYHPGYKLECQRFQQKIVNLQKKNKLAILYSIDSNNGLQLQPFNSNFYDIPLGPWNSRNAYIKVLKRFYKAFYDLNIEVDFVFPRSTNFEKYDVQVVPPLYIALTTCFTN